MRYYSTQRPIGPGTFPKPQGNAVKEVFNFDSKTYCEEVGREAWGYIEYEQPIDPQAAADHFLVADGVGCTGCVHEAASRDMDCCWNIGSFFNTNQELPSGCCFDCISNLSTEMSLRLP